MDKRRNHIIFWVGYFLLFYTYSVLVLNQILTQGQIFIVTFISVLIASTSFYILIIYLYPYTLSKGKRINALLGIVFLGGCTSLLYCSIVYTLRIAIPQVFTTVNIKSSFIFMFSRYIIVVYLSIAYYFIQKHQTLWIINRKAEMRTFELQKTISQTELLGLKNQINPHFFYNVLNFLYSQSLQSFHKLSEPILTLSEMMRYSIIESFDNDKVSLESEIKYLQNFIKLENLQNDGNKKIRLNIIGNTLYRRIIPLCLVPFIENIYRYSKTNNKESFIDVTLEINNEQLKLSSNYEKEGNVFMEVINQDFYKIKQDIITKYSNNCHVESNLKGQFYTFLCSISL